MNSVQSILNNLKTNDSLNGSNIFSKDIVQEQCNFNQETCNNSKNNTRIENVSQMPGKRIADSCSPIKTTNATTSQNSMVGMSSLNNGTVKLESLNSSSKNGSQPFFSCEYCSQTFKKTSWFMHHMKTLHADAEMESTPLDDFIEVIKIIKNFHSFSGKELLGKIEMFVETTDRNIEILNYMNNNFNHENATQLFEDQSNIINIEYALFDKLIDLMISKKNELQLAYAQILDKIRVIIKPISPSPDLINDAPTILNFIEATTDENGVVSFKIQQSIEENDNINPSSQQTECYEIVPVDVNEVSTAETNNGKVTNDDYLIEVTVLDDEQTTETKSSKKKESSDVKNAEIKKPKIVHSPSKVKSKVCSYCDRPFATTGDLTRHIRLHTGERPFVCNFDPTNCKLAFIASGDLKKHLRRHNRPNVPIPRNFVCQVCNKDFDRAFELKRHEAVHTIDSPDTKTFNCEFCKKKFYRKDHYTQHMYRHLGVKSFKCQHCAKLFNDRSNCLKHERRHNRGNMKFTCDYCKSGFRYKNTILKHFDRCAKLRAITKTNQII